MKRPLYICALGAALMLIAPAGVAQTLDQAPIQLQKPAPGAFFNPGAKRVKPPKPGERRITVQIDPEEQAASLVKPELKEPA
ncbi:MAG: hypothetical protein OIF35_13190, partial [Cellvibrionaceae bacterium]|nr:hypothetical protein [Cellvibrionaceae bacterium]